MSFWLNLVVILSSSISMANAAGLRRTTPVSVVRDPPPTAESKQEQQQQQQQLDTIIEQEQKKHPYLAAIVDADNEIQCTGALIAPDMILTAGHCNSDKNAIDSVILMGQPDSQVKVEQKILHPQWNNDLGINFDFLLLKLSASSTEITVPTIALNRDPEFPSSTGQELTYVGWEETDNINIEDDNDTPTISDATVSYIAQQECANIKDGDDTLSYFLTNEMLCVMESTQNEICKGEYSGGTLLGRRNQEEVLVGAVSFGEDCETQKQQRQESSEHEAFPSFFGRISTVASWIDNTVCSVSSSSTSSLLSSGFNCHETTSPSSYYLTLDLDLDIFPHETFWTLEVFDFMKGKWELLGGTRYFSDQMLESVHEKVHLLSDDDDKTYRVLIGDHGRDGLCCDYGNGSFQLYFHDDSNEHSKHLLGAGSQFRDETSVVFTVPSGSNNKNGGNGDELVLPYHIESHFFEQEAIPPLSSPSETFLTFIVKFGDLPETVGWSVHSVAAEGKQQEDGEDHSMLLLADMPVGAYWDGLEYSKGSVQIPLSKSDTTKPTTTTTTPATTRNDYRFTLKDTSSDGLAYYQLWLGSPANGGELLSEGNANSFQEGMKTIEFQLNQPKDGKSVIVQKVE